MSPAKTFNIIEYWELDDENVWPKNNLLVDSFVTKYNPTTRTSRHVAGTAGQATRQMGKYLEFVDVTCRKLNTWPNWLRAATIRTWYLSDRLMKTFESEEAPCKN